MTEIQDFPQRYFLINENISESAITDIIKQIHATNDYDDLCEGELKDYERPPIKIVVESYGGDVYSGMTLVNTISTSITPVFTYSYGKTMSMGLPIFAAGHVRFAHPNTTFMYHEMSGGMHGTLDSIKDNVEEWNRLSEIVDGFVIENSEITKDLIDTYKAFKKDWFFSGKEAHELGLVDILLEGFNRKDIVIEVDNGKGSESDDE